MNQLQSIVFVGIYRSIDWAAFAQMSGRFQSRFAKLTSFHVFHTRKCIQPEQRHSEKSNRSEGHICRSILMYLLYCVSICVFMALMVFSRYDGNHYTYLFDRCSIAPLLIFRILCSIYCAWNGDGTFSPSIHYQHIIQKGIKVKNKIAKQRIKWLKIELKPRHKRIGRKQDEHWKWNKHLPPFIDNQYRWEREIGKESVGINEIIKRIVGLAKCKTCIKRV